MSQEEVHVIKQVKYVRWSHEIMRLTYNQLQTKINSEMVQEKTLTWNDAVSEPNRHLVFTVRTSTDVRIIPWIGLRIACVSGAQRARIWIGSGSPATVRISLNDSERCNTQPTPYSQAHRHIRVHPRTYIYIHFSKVACTCSRTHAQHTHMNECT